MTDETADSEVAFDETSPYWPKFRAFWETKVGAGVALAIALASLGVLLFGNLSGLGIWEPWEAKDVLVAQEYQDRPDPPETISDPKAPSYNWAVPTRDRRPVQRSFLKTWSMALSLEDESSADQFEVGELEFWARFPMALAVFLVVLGGFFWIRHFFGGLEALVGALAFVSTPAIAMGVHSVSTEMFFVATTTAAILTFGGLLYAEGGQRYVWGAGFGVTLGLAFLDQRFIGVLLPLAVIVAFALVQLPFERAARVERELEDGSLVGGVQIAGFILCWLIGVAAVYWGWTATGEGAIFAAHVEQLLAVALPTLLLASGVALAWRTRPVRRLRSAPGLVGLGLASAIAFPLLEAYADANPTLIKNGEILGRIPVLTYTLENHVYGLGFPTDHMYFALWIREIGFSLFYWAGFAALGVGYLARSTRLTDRDGVVREEILEPADSLKRLLLVWAFISVGVLAVGSIYQHYFYPAYFPLVVGAALLMTDSEFWIGSRRRTLLPLFAGVVVIAVIAMLSKDLARWPARLVESYLMYEQDLGLPEEFRYGAALDAMKYVWMGLAALFFFGLVSWAPVALERVRSIPGDLKDWWQDWREGELAGTLPSQAAVAAAEQRARAKRDVRRSEGPAGLVARIVEAPSTFALLLAGAMTVSAGVCVFGLAPRLGHHLSQRGVFETYTRLRDEGESLYRLRVSTGETSVYLREVEKLGSRREFIERFDADSRFFAVIQRDALSSLNRRTREKYDRDIPVLDERSSRLLLVSNKLEEGETNHNFIADAIVDGEPEVQHEVTFPKNGEQVHPTFDGELKLLGYTLDKKGEVPTYSWGDEVKLTTYFKVLDRVSGRQKIFMHVDHPGSRIHGDHYPVGGDFPTNDWLPGDIVKDVYHLKVSPYSSTGVYTMYFGFYRAGSRMDVSPESAHDGENRIPMGEIRVSGF
ncbi:MAG: ArnT family glycosyltransferase [Bradymonadaceae bacterium]